MNPLNQTQIPVFHSERCSLFLPVVVQQFDTVAVYYCQECFAFRYDYDFCEHEYIPVLFEVKGGHKQIRMYCKKCYRLSVNAQKYNGYDISKLPFKKRTKYDEFYSKKFNEEKGKINDFVEDLRIKAYEFKTKPYYDYLQSSIWKEKRDSVLKRDDYKCQICGGPAENVHHLTYRNLGKEYPFELVSLCKLCHVSVYHQERFDELILQTSNQ